MNDSYNTIGNDPTIQEINETLELVSGMTLLGRYRLEMVAGKGNMGVVWKAWDEIAERWVALKFVLRESRASADSSEKLKKAFDTIKALNHQNIGQVYSIEKDPDFGYFVVIKWLEGKPLSKTEIPREQINYVLAQVADALDYAHKKGVIHRDVKPSNIFIEKDFETFLIDFGIAAGIQNSILEDVVSEVCLTSGTRQYMAPEQWRGLPQDGRTDQYALGVVAYQLYAGGVPFQNSEACLLRLAILQDTPEPIKNVPQAVNSAILRALSKEREDRFATCREFIEALNGKGETSPVPTPSTKRGSSWKWPVAIAILLLVGLVLYFSRAEGLSIFTPDEEISPPVSQSTEPQLQEQILNESQEQTSTPVDLEEPTPEPTPMTADMQEPAAEPTQTPVDLEEPTPEPTANQTQKQTQKQSPKQSQKQFSTQSPKQSQKQSSTQSPKQSPKQSQKQSSTQSPTQSPKQSPKQSQKQW